MPAETADLAGRWPLDDLPGRAGRAAGGVRLREPQLPRHPPPDRGARPPRRARLRRRGGAAGGVVPRRGLRRGGRRRGALGAVGRAGAAARSWRGEVARLVRVTAAHDPDRDDLAGQQLCDADLAILASPADALRRSTRATYAGSTPPSRTPTSRGPRGDPGRPAGPAAAVPLRAGPVALGGSRRGPTWPPSWRVRPVWPRRSCAERERRQVVRLAPVLRRRSPAATRRCTSSRERDRRGAGVDHRAVPLLRHVVVVPVEAALGDAELARRRRAARRRRCRWRGGTTAGRGPAASGGSIRIIRPRTGPPGPGRRRAAAARTGRGRRRRTPGPSRPAGPARRRGTAAPRPAANHGTCSAASPPPATSSRATGGSVEASASRSS